MVRRSRQVDRLRRAEAPLIVLTAPPGYGKTTLVRQWAEEDERSFLWISLDAGDDDPAVLLMYLMRVLSASESFGTDVLAGPIGDQEFLTAVTLPRLGQALASRSERFVLVLDDTHVLHGSSWNLVASLVEQVPSGSQIVLAGRTAPELLLGRLLAHRRMVRLLAMDLIMTVDETQMLARAVGLELDAAIAATLVDRTEGWPASLYLAVLSLRGRGDLETAVAEFRGTDRLVAEYIQEELLAPADDDVHRFLLYTSVLRTLSGPLCDALLRRRGSAAMLARISRDNALLTPLGRESWWYRYHQLFADVLRAELRRIEPESEIELHRRASTLYREQGDAEEAIHHAHAAGNEELAAELVWGEATSQLTTGRFATLERWMNGFDRKRLVCDPFLALTSAGCALAAGRSVDHWLVTAAHAARRQAPGGARDPAEVDLAVSIFRAVMARGGAEQMAADATAIARLAPASSAARALSHYLHGVASDQLGDAAEAIAQLEAGALLSARVAMPATQALCLAYLTYLACLAGNWSRMDMLATQTRRLVEVAQMHDFISMTSVHASLALALAHQSRMEEAERTVKQALWLLTAIAPIAPWWDVHTRVMIGRVHLLLGDPAAARAVLAEAQQAAALVPDAPEMLRQLDQAWSLAQAAPLTTWLGPSSVSPAELRVLRLLPTHLTFAEISDLLFLSRNTVKTQALSAYHKLGVSSRAEAVDTARQLGFIPGVSTGSGAAPPSQP